MTERRTPKLVWDTIKSYSRAKTLTFRSHEGTVTRTLDVKKVVFQLIAFEIMQIKFDSKSNDIILVPTRSQCNSTEM